MSNTTLGERIVFERKRLGLNQSELATLIDSSTVSTGAYERNERSIPSDKLEILYKNGFDASYIITGERATVAQNENAKTNNINAIGNGAPSKQATVANSIDSNQINPEDYAWIPLYDIEVSAGDGRFADNENIITHMSFTKYSLKKRNLNADKLGFVIVHGDSMTPSLQPNDCILIDFEKRNPDGGVFVVRVGESLHVKRLILEKECIRVISDNERYREWSLDKNDDFEILGKFCWVGRYAV